MKKLDAELINAQWHDGTARPSPVKPGQRLGRLVVVNPEVRLTTPSRPKGWRAAVCRCDCGNEVTVTHADLLRAGPKATRSCGCLRAERRREWAQARAVTTITNGLRYHPLYGTWNNMLSRCENPGDKDYKRYGGRDIPITVCPGWHDVMQFITDIEAEIGSCPKGKFLDRIDNDGPYASGNVRWADRWQQIRNSRSAKLNARLVRLLRRAVVLGILPESLAAGAGISREHLRRVLRHEVWADVDDEHGGQS